MCRNGFLSFPLTPTHGSCKWQSQESVRQVRVFTVKIFRSPNLTWGYSIFDPQGGWQNANQK